MRKSVSCGGKVKGLGGIGTGLALSVVTISPPEPLRPIFKGLSLLRPCLLDFVVTTSPSDPLRPIKLELRNLSNLKKPELFGFASAALERSMLEALRTIAEEFLDALFLLLPPPNNTSPLDPLLPILFLVGLVCVSDEASSLESSLSVVGVLWFLVALLLAFTSSARLPLEVERGITGSNRLTRIDMESSSLFSEGDVLRSVILLFGLRRGRGEFRLDETPSLGISSSGTTWWESEDAPLPGTSS